MVDKYIIVYGNNKECSNIDCDCPGCPEYSVKFKNSGMVPILESHSNDYSFGW